MSYRSAAPEDPTREVAFDALAPETQQRLAAACSGHGATPLLVDRPALLGTPGLWAALLLAAVALSAPVLLSDLGSLRGGPRLYNTAEQATLALGATASLLALLLGARSARARRGLPFSPGVYLFARELVDARKTPLVLIPTAQLQGVRRTRRRVELSFAGGERHAFRVAESESPGEIEREIRACLETLQRAESTGDVATRVGLDPFDAERPRWIEQPPQAASPRSRTLLRVGPWPLVAAALVAGPPLSQLVATAVGRAGDAYGIRQARLASDEGALSSFLNQGGAASANRLLADEALYTLARASTDNSILLRYLELAHALRAAGTPLAHHQHASDELHRRIVDHRTIDVVRAFVAHGVGPLRDQEDQALFDDAMASRNPLDHRDCFALDRYAVVGSRGNEVRDLHLPRCLLDQAMERGNIDRLRSLSRGTGPDEVRADALAALHREYREARDRLARVTGLRTPLARALDAALAHAADHGGALVLSTPPDPADGNSPTARVGPWEADRELSDYLASSLLGSTRRALAIYLGEALLPIRDKPPQAPPQGEYSTIQLGYIASAACRTDIWPVKPGPCEVTLELSFRIPQAPDIPPQTLHFKGLLPDGKGHYNREKYTRLRPLPDVAQETIVHALLGDTK